MEPDKEKWINEVLNSFSDSKRARPDTGLFTKILARLDPIESKIVPLFLVRTGMVAAIILLILNVLSLRYYLHNNTFEHEATMTDIVPGELIFDFKIYEE